MSIYQSLFMYIACFTISAILVYAGGLTKYKNITLPFPARQRVNLFTISGLMIPILIGGLLYHVGIDYDGYIRLFEKSNELDYAGFVAYNGFWTVEPTFYLLARTSMFLTNSSWLLFTFYSAINITFIYFFLKRMIPNQRAIGFYIYLFVFFLFTMTLMRQGAAIAICLFALTFLLERKYVVYLSLIAVASLIHFSALFFLVTLPLFLLVRPAKPNWLTLVLILLGGVLAVTSPALIQLVTAIPPFDKYTYLLNKTRGETLIGWTFLLQLIILMIVTLTYYKISRKFKFASMLYAMLLTGIVAYSLNFRIDYASRFSYFFLPVSTVLVPYSISAFANNRILKVLILVGCIAYFIKVYYVGNTMMVFPYNAIWSV